MVFAKKYEALQELEKGILPKEEAEWSGALKIRFLHEKKQGENSGILSKRLLASYGRLDISEVKVSNFDWQSIFLPQISKIFF